MRSAPSARASRVLRAAAAASVATFTALMSHIAGGGQLPNLLGIVTPLVLAWAFSTLLVGRRLSLWRLSAAVVASQFLFHSLFTLGTSGAASATGAAGAASATGAAHAHGAASAAVTAASGAAASAGGPAITWPPMTAAHIVAAIVTIAALYGAERIVRGATAVITRAQEWLARLWREPQVAPLPAPTPPRLGFVSILSVRTRAGTGPRTLRGPPPLRFV